MTLNVAFLWHMHQPMYLDPFTHEFLMPWVRLHGVKAYSDMISLFEKGEVAEACKVTFNLVPSLLKQLKGYQNRKDIFFELSSRDPGDLSLQDKAFILRHFFSCHWPTMVEPHERYRQLLEARGRHIEKLDLEAVAASFSHHDIRDLQVWFNLAWVGFSLSEDPFISGLLAKGRLFSEAEKRELLEFHLRILNGLISRYRALWEQERIDISTSPFYHPILPLIIDTESARRCMPNARLPARFSYPEDAEVQLVKAREFMNELFGRPPLGLWPSEGSVSPELVPLAEKVGFEWMATDEGILHNTLGEHAGVRLFQPYRVTRGRASLAVVFRHHELSDLIGFVYQKTEPGVATRDFHRRLKEILRNCEGMFQKPPLCIIALDGENPWEYYLDGGKEFLKGLYTSIASDPDIHLTTITDYIHRYPPEIQFNELYTGSWINSDFSIWIGGREENDAWEELLSARLALSHTDTAQNREDSMESAREHLLVAQGSDWFWWYGDKFHSDFAPIFDRLFRDYLKSAYNAMGQPYPASLDTPIKIQVEPARVTPPVAFIDPEIDGRLSFYWEWAGAGSITPSTKDSMYKSTIYINEVAYGFNVDCFFVKVVPTNDLDLWGGDKTCIIVGIHGEHDVEIRIGGQGAECTSASIDFEVLFDGKKKSCDDIGVRLAFDEIVEIATPFVLLGKRAGEEVDFFVRLDHNDVTVERWPETGTISFEVPDRDFERRIWLI